MGAWSFASLDFTGLRRLLIDGHLQPVGELSKLASLAALTKEALNDNRTQPGTPAFAFNLIRYSAKLWMIFLHVSSFLDSLSLPSS